MKAILAMALVLGVCGLAGAADDKIVVAPGETAVRAPKRKPGGGTR